MCVTLQKLVGLLKETGWPSKGDSNEPHATVDNADTYNSNLIKYIFDRSGIPFHLEYTYSVYIYELFNEDLRKCFGLGLGDLEELIAQRFNSGKIAISLIMSRITLLMHLIATIRSKEGLQ
ncbi:glucan endo-1,3-beta-glucosidase 1 [Tanacetum coccineum]